MPLTETELKKIKQEAISYCNKNHSGSDKVYKAAYEAHIAAVTKEREAFAKKEHDLRNELQSLLSKQAAGFVKLLTAELERAKVLLDALNEIDRKAFHNNEQQLMAEIQFVIKESLKKYNQ